MVRLIHQPAGGADLLEQYRQSGSPDIFAQIMRAYGGMVLSVCYKVTKDAADAEDASQAVFLTLAVQCKTGAPIQYLGPWLKKVAKRTALDLVRSRKRRTRRETVTAENRPEYYTVRPAARPEADELNAILRAELDELPGKYRMPLVLHYFGGMSHDQISKEMGCTTAALGVRLHRARKMLGKRLTARGISLEGVALGAALAVAVPAVFSDRFIRTTQAAIAGLNYAQPVMTAGLPDNFAAVLSLVNQVGASMARQRLKMATAVLAASITLLGGAAEATRFLPESLRPNLEFLAPSNLLKNLLSPTLRLPQLHVSAAEVKVAVGGDRLVEPLPPVLTASVPAPLPAVANQPVLALQWTVPLPPPTPAATTIPLPTLTQAAALQTRPIALATLATTASVANPRPTPSADNDFRIASAGGGNGVSASETAESATALNGRPPGPGGPGRRPDAPLPPPPEAFGTRPTQNLPDVRPVGGFEFSAVGGATFDHVPVLDAAAAFPRQPGPVPLPADAAFVPSSVVMRHGDVFVPGDGHYQWADRFVGIDKDGVNSADFTLHDVAPGGGVVAIERLPVTTTAAPARPVGHHFVGIWALATTVDFSSIHLTAHYDVAFAQSLGLPENVLKLWVFDPKQTDWIRITDGSFSRDLFAHTVSGTYDGVPTFFAVSAPEPAVLGVVGVAGALLLRRRRRSSPSPLGGKGSSAIDRMSTPE